MGGSFGREWICVYVFLSPFAIPLKLSQHCYPIQNKKLKKKKRKQNRNVLALNQAPHMQVKERLFIDMLSKS